MVKNGLVSMIQDGWTCLCNGVKILIYAAVFVAGVALISGCEVNPSPTYEPSPTSQPADTR